MSRYLREDRPPEPKRPCYAPEEWSDLADWEESRGDHYKAKVEEIEAENDKLKAQVEDLKAEIKLWHDTLDGTVHSTCHVMRLMEKVIGNNDE